MDQPAMQQLVQARQTVQLAQLRKTNELAYTYGNVLSETQLHSLIRAEEDTLRDYGRLEFGEGILPRLLYAFCDSPLITKSDYFDTLCTLQELFYAYHDELNDAMSDDELLEAMHNLFHGRAQGSLEYMGNISPIHLVRALNGEEAEDDDD